MEVGREGGGGGRGRGRREGSLGCSRRGDGLGRGRERGNGTSSGVSDLEIRVYWRGLLAEREQLKRKRQQASNITTKLTTLPAFCFAYHYIKP